MAVPKKKTSKSKRNTRRSHLALKPINISINSKTGEYVLPHHMSLTDRTYKGREIISKPVKNEE
jgi:large subunit ribosomal protein L32